jgi:uncharacterized protein (TIGR02118 family)
VIHVIGTAYKNDDLTSSEFFRYYREVHAPLNKNIPGLRGYVVWEVTRKLTGELETPDAFVSQWYDDEAAMAVADASPEMAEAWEDVPKYAKVTGTWWATKAHVYMPPPIIGPGTLTNNAWIAPFDS